MRVHSIESKYKSWNSIRQCLLACNGALWQGKNITNLVLHNQSFLWFQLLQITSADSIVFNISQTLQMVVSNLKSPRFCWSRLGVIGVRSKFRGKFRVKITVSFRVALQKFNNALICYSFRIQFGLISTISCNLFDMHIPKHFWNMESPLTNVSAGNHQVITDGKILKEQ